MIGEIAEDNFLTFLPPKPLESQTLNLQQLLIEVVKRHNFSVREFWDMPLPLVLELLGLLVPPSKKPMSRKSLIDNEKRLNRMQRVH